MDGGGHLSADQRVSSRRDGGVVGHLKEIGGRQPNSSKLG
jgi:hypothetical protein